MFKSFDKFQNLKYNNVNEWDKLVYNYKLETVYNLDRLKHTENFTSKKVIKHILEGEINRRGKTVGFHLESIPTKKGKVIEKTRSKVDNNGIYKVKVIIDGVPKIAKSTTGKIENRDFGVQSGFGADVGKEKTIIYCDFTDEEVEISTEQFKELSETWFDKLEQFHKTDKIN